MISLDNYANDGFSGQENSNELIKAMQAGNITGRDTTNQPLSYEPLKVESLEKNLKVLEYRTSDIKLFNALPKQTAYNTVEEYLQLVSYGSQRGGFYDEGELSDVEDSTYMRRAEHVKFMQVTGEITIQTQMVRSYVDAMKRAVEDKMMWIMRLANTSLTKGDSEIISQEFNSLYKQHASIGSTSESLYSTFEDYYNSGTVIDMRGKSLKQEDVEKSAVQVDLNYGIASSLFAPTTVISALSQDYYNRQRILLDGQFGGNANTVIKSITTTVGNVDLNADKFMKSDSPRTAVLGATGSKSPSAPTVTAVAAVVDNRSKYAGAELGSCYYAVAAINRYGESALTVHGTAIALSAGSGVDITVAPTAGANATQGFVVYRTKLTTAPTATGLIFYPLYRVSVAGAAAGFNGAGVGVVRDLGYFLPDTEQAFITDINDDVMAFKQLAPMSKLDLAVLSMSRRFIVFMFGTPVVFAPKKIVRFINVGKSLL